MKKIVSSIYRLKKIKNYIFSKISRVFSLKNKYSLQNFNSSQKYKIIRLGSNYGGWSFVDDSNLKNCTILSAGLGEDASFDIEFASKYNAKIIIIDPTPRAIKHYHSIIKSIGIPSKIDYVKGGEQPISSYDLSQVSKKNFFLIEKALWFKKEKLKFYEPPNPEHVSYSINNYQNKYSDSTNFIKVDTVTIEEILIEFGLGKEDIPLIKLDIEGAEIEFIGSCIKKGFRPMQILVEFDELNTINKKGYKRFADTHNLLCLNGYQLLKSNQSDFLYYRIN